jgi:hypothetical protein
MLIARHLAASRPRRDLNLMYVTRTTTTTRDCLV